MCCYLPKWSNYFQDLFKYNNYYCRQCLEKHLENFLYRRKYFLKNHKYCHLVCWLNEQESVLSKLFLFNYIGTKTLLLLQKLFCATSSGDTELFMLSKVPKFLATHCLELAILFIIWTEPSSLLWAPKELERSAVLICVLLEQNQFCIPSKASLLQEFPRWGFRLLKRTAYSFLLLATK